MKLCHDGIIQKRERSRFGVRQNLKIRENSGTNRARFMHPIHADPRIMWILRGIGDPRFRCMDLQVHPITLNQRLRRKKRQHISLLRMKSSVNGKTIKSAREFIMRRLTCPENLYTKVCGSVHICRYHMLLSFSNFLRNMGIAMGFHSRI